ncbi:hypothetical protein ACVZHJ_08570 [Vibrio diabolicus]
MTTELVVKKLLLATAVVAAAGGAGYLYQNNTTPSDSVSLLSQVPADSLMVTYQTEPFNHYKYMNAFGTANQGSIAELFADEPLSPQQQFAVNLFDGYLESAASPETLKAYLGTGENINPVLYTIGMVPVYKLKIEDPAALWKTLDHEEQMSGAKHELVKLGDVEFRRYEMTDSVDPQDGIGLVVAVVDNVLTLTVDIPQLGVQNPLKMALGLESPSQNIAESGRLAALQAKYGENNNSFGYFDHRELVKGLTTKDGNIFARQVSMLDAIDPEPTIQEMRSPACHTELTQVAENWPQSVAFAEYKLKGEQAFIKGAFVVESKNKVILDALKSIRGVLAESNNDKSFFSMALGLDINTLAPSIGQIWSDLTQPQYQCSLLTQMQQEMGGQNPAAAVSMGSGMVNGLKGLSLQMFDIHVDTNAQHGEVFSQLDGMLSLSANDPMMLIQTAQMFVPELAQLQIQPDNQPVNVSDLLEMHTGLKMDVFARLNENHFTLYSGENAEDASKEVMAQPLSPNGLFSFDFDSERILEVLESASAVTGEPLPDDVMKSLQGELVGGMTMDVTDQGIGFEFDYRGATNPVTVAQQ